MFLNPRFSMHLCFVSVCTLLITVLTSSVWAETISFEKVLSEADGHYFGLKIAESDVEVNRCRVDEATADYYPSLSLRLGNEYSHVFDPDGDGVDSVGDAIIANDQSAYKHSVIASLKYNLFDFGIRKLTVVAARRELRIAQLGADHALGEMSQDVLALYADGLKLDKQIQVMKSIFSRRKTVFRLCQQLREAGTVGEAQVAAAALELAKAASLLENLQIDMYQVLSSLTLYTQNEYFVEDISFEDLSVPTAPPQLPAIETLSEIEIYQERINRKVDELTIVKRSMLPQFTLYGAYRMFGSDQSSFSQSFGNLNSRDASITLYVDWTLFSGFGDVAKMRRLQSEIRSLDFSREKRVAELQQEIDSTYGTYKTYAGSRDKRAKHLEQLGLNQSHMCRLAEQKITDQVTFHEKMISLLQQRLDVDFKQIDFAVAALKLELMGRTQR